MSALTDMHDHDWGLTPDAELVAADLVERGAVT